MCMQHKMLCALQPNVTQCNNSQTLFIQDIQEDA